MTPELKSRWVAALRSDKYKQGRGRLASKGKYCCLGVLCQIENEPIDSEDIIPKLSFLDKIDLSVHKANALAQINDDGMSFSTIADKIEAIL